MKTALMLAVLVLVSPAAAQEGLKDPGRPAFDHAPLIPDEATKKAALLRAYHLNGDSMTRWGSIDLSQQEIPKSVRVIPLGPQKPRDDPGLRR